MSECARVHDGTMHSKPQAEFMNIVAGSKFGISLDGEGESATADQMESIR